MEPALELNAAPETLSPEDILNSNEIENHQSNVSDASFSDSGIGVDPLAGNDVNPEFSVSEQVANVIASAPSTDWYDDNVKGAVAEKDVLFNSLLNKYIDDYEIKHRHKRNLKIAFFVVIVTLLFIITISIIVIFVILINNLSDDIVAFITASTTLAVEFVVAFFQLPKIIAEYLFDKKEDELFIEMVAKMQDYNLHRFDNKK